MLQESWLTDGLIDFEYKKYVLLAYLNSVQKNFSLQKLYPDLSELINHYNALKKYSGNKEGFTNSLPKRLDSLDLKNFMLHYEELVKDDEMMEEIEKIVSFSIPEIQRRLNEGKDIYEWVEKALEFRPVGVQPLDAQFGYLFLRNGGEKQTGVYEYRLTIFESHEEKYRGIHTHYVTTYSCDLHTSYESLKLNLIRDAKLLSIPAVYLAESNCTLPVGETFLPVAKRILVKYLAGI